MFITRVIITLLLSGLYALLSACSTPLNAAHSTAVAMPLTPGEWQTTTQFNMPDMPVMSAQMTPQVSSSCLDAARAGKPLQTLAKHINSHYTNASCHSRYTSIDQNHVSWKAVCQTPPSRLQGTLTRHSSQHYSAHIKITVPMITLIQLDAHRLKSCR